MFYVRYPAAPDIRIRSLWYRIIRSERHIRPIPNYVTTELKRLGKLYVANAGDSRAVLCRHSRAYPMSFDFTPVTERQRLQTIGRLQPHLLGT